MSARYPSGRYPYGRCGCDRPLSRGHRCLPCEAFSAYVRSFPPLRLWDRVRGRWVPNVEGVMPRE